MYHWGELCFVFHAWVSIHCAAGMVPGRCLEDLQHRFCIQAAAMRCSLARQELHDPSMERRAASVWLPLLLRCWTYRATRSDPASLRRNAFTRKNALSCFGNVRYM